MEWSRRVECHIFLIYQKLIVQDFNFQLFGIRKGVHFEVWWVHFSANYFYSNPSGRGVTEAACHYLVLLARR